MVRIWIFLCLVFQFLGAGELASWGAQACGEGPGRWTVRAHDVPYQPGVSPANSMKLDIYFPGTRAPHGLLKTVMLIHGGCFAWGGKAEPDTLVYVRRLINIGYAVVSVDYRLTDTSRHVNEWPASMHDVQDAVRWLRQHGAEYGLDTSRLVVMGYSAGGTLAAYLGTRSIVGSVPPKGSCTDAECLALSRRVDGVIDFFGRTDFIHAYTPDYVRGLGINTLPELKRDPSARDCAEVYTGRSHGDLTMVDASVLSQPDPRDPRHVLSHVDDRSACTLIVHGTQDTAVSIMHSALFHAQLVQSANMSEPEKQQCFPFVAVRGGTHMFIDPTAPPELEKIDPVAESQGWAPVCPFLGRILGPPSQ